MGGEGGGGGQGGQMTQTMYAHVNKWIIKKKNLKKILLRVGFGCSYDKEKLAMLSGRIVNLTELISSLCVCISRIFCTLRIYNKNVWGG
jgi:hypothetical protein